MTAAVRIHDHSGLKENTHTQKQTQTHVWNTRAGDFGGFNTEPVGPRKAEGLKPTVYSSVPTATLGTTWPNDIWGSTAGLKNLGSLGSETTVLKEKRIQSDLTFPSDPWAKRTSQWNPVEPGLPASFTKPTSALTSVQSRHTQHASNKPTPVSVNLASTKKPVVLPSLKSASAAKFVETPNNGLTTTKASGPKNGQSQIVTPPGLHGYGRSLLEFDSAYHSSFDPNLGDWELVDPSLSDWEELSPFSVHGQGLLNYPDNSQTTDQRLPVPNLSMFRADTHTDRQIQSYSSWPQRGFDQPRPTNQWDDKVQNISATKHQDGRYSAGYRKTAQFDATSNIKRDDVTDPRNIPFPGDLRTQDQSQTRQPLFISGNNSYHPQTFPTPDDSNWANMSYTWEAVPTKPFAGKFEIPRNFEPSLQKTHGINDPSCGHFGDGYSQVFTPSSYMGNGLVPRQPYSIVPFMASARSQGASGEMMIPSPGHRYMHHQMKQAVAQQMHSYYQYPFGLGPYETAISDYSSHMHLQQLLLQRSLLPNGLSPHTDIEHGVRSALLEEFRNNKSHRSWELRDIWGHILEFSGDQQGARFIQTKLETANSSEKERVFWELFRDAIPLMKDVFGNWVIQKFFEFGDQNHKRLLVMIMKGHVMDLTTQMYGCRVVQRALEHVLVDQKICLVQELERHVIRCVKDQHGNHVIQKAIEWLPAKSIQFIYDALVGQIHHLAIHNFGCRVVQRLLERSHGQTRFLILRELHACAITLAADQYGNYVIQNVLEHGDADDRAKLNSVIKTHLILFSKQKYASNVVEASLSFGTNEYRCEIMHLLTIKNVHGENQTMGLVNDPYGNYVIKKLLDTLTPADGAYFTEQLKPDVGTVCQIQASYKQVNNIAKKMQKFDNSFYQSQCVQTMTRPLQINSSARSTPPLIMDDAQSPLSSSLPSTAGDNMPSQVNSDQRGQAQKHLDIKIEVTRA